MPTAGQYNKFSGLEANLMHIRVKYGDSIAIFIRGDMNASPKNTSRYPLLLNLLEEYNFNRVQSAHSTYHHFTGLNGEFDSDLDVLLHSSFNDILEELKLQICKKVHPLVHSHHDILISKFSLPAKQSCRLYTV